MEESSVKNDYFVAIGKDISYLGNFAYNESDNTIDKTPISRNQHIKTDILCKIFNEKNSSGDSIILPKNTRFHKSASNYDIFVIEEPPMVRTIMVSDYFSDVIPNLKASGKFEMYGIEEAIVNRQNGATKFNLAFPYIVYMIRVGKRYKDISVSVYYRNAPINNMSDDLYNSNLPNISIDGNVCMGTIKTDYIHGLPHKYVEYAIQAFWNNSFNLDLSNEHIAYSKKFSEISDFFTWQYNSRIDPMFMLRLNWNRRSSIKTEMSRHTETRYEEKDFFKFFASCLTSSLEISPSDNLDEIENENQTLMYALTDSYFDVLNHSNILVGDNFILDDKPFVVTSFIGYSGELPIKMELTDMETKETKIVDISSDSFSKLHEKSDEKLKKILNREQSYTTTDGIEIKDGDLLELSSPGLSENIYTKHFNPRVALDGNLEINVLGTFFLITDKTKISKVDFIKASADGIEIRENNEYIISNFNYTGHLPTAVRRKVKITKFSISEDGGYARNILVRAKNLINSTSVDYRLDALQGRIAHDNPYEENLITSVVYRDGNKLITPENTKMNREYVGGKLNSFFITDNENIDVYNLNTISNFMNSVKDRVYVPGLDFDIDLSVGESVIFTDWSNPDSFSNILTIEKFEIEESKLYVVAKDPSGMEVKQKLMDALKRNIDSISIRKVAHQVDDIRVGDFVKAKISGIPYFPKKDAHKVVSIVIDDPSGHPLIVCSNLCTIFHDSEINEKFEFFHSDSPKYSKLIDSGVNVDVYYIPIQPEDIFSENVDRLYTVFDDYRLYDFNNHCVTRNNITNHYFRAGVILPRHTKVSIKSGEYRQYFMGVRGFVPTIYVSTPYRSIIKNTIRPPHGDLYV